MPTTIKLKNSVTTTSAPSSLAQGEVAINVTDKKVWVGNAATTPVQLLGDGGSGSFTSIAFGAGTVSAPSITFTGDTNTGIYSPAADTIAFTEGGVESMRINSSGNVLVGTATAQELLTVNKNAAFGTTADAFSEIRFFNSTATAGTTRVRATAGDLTFLTSNAERMRITSGGDVGIGASSPTAKLQVAGAIHLTGAGTFPATGEGLELVPSVAGGDNYVQAYSRNSSTYQKLIISASQTALQTGGSTRMFFAANGNIGLSTSTPSNWTGGFASMEYNGANGFYSQGTQASISSNAYNNVGWKYAGTGTAGLFTNVQGDFTFYGADSGTAGNAISSLAQILQVKKDYTLALQGTSTVVGTGLTFPATQNASSNANTLDDYEEGTWTPTVYGAGGSIGSQAYSLQAGRYVKIGRFVVLTGYLTLSNKGSWTGQIKIAGFPFAVDNVQSNYSAHGFYAINMTLPALSYGVGAFTVIGTTTADMWTNTNGGINVLADYANQVNNNSQIGPFQFCYYANA